MPPDEGNDVHFLAIQELSKLIGSRQISSVELTRTMLERIERYKPKRRSYTLVTAERALEKANSIEAGFPLAADAPPTIAAVPAATMNSRRDTPIVPV